MSLEPLTIDCEGDRMIGLLHRPSTSASRGVVVVVGGPQYRVGAGRQFVTLANRLCEAGIPVLRFDCRGMGDSDGELASFLELDRDIDAAITALLQQVPALEDVVLWGLCDASSAIMLYAHGDPRVSGMVLLNPWVRSEAGQSKVFLRHYYLQRLLQPAFWAKVRRQEFNPLRSAQSFAQHLIRAAKSDRPAAAGKGSPHDSARAIRDPTLPYQERMRLGLERFQGRVMLILSGNDHTAREFELLTADSGKWHRLLEQDRIRRHTLADADHTFSRAVWLDQVVSWTDEWVGSW